jgi:uncharacterized membrane protein YgcG
MDHRLIEALDDTLTRLDEGESLETCLARYPELASELTGLVQVRTRLDVLAPVPLLSPRVIVARRREFLATARGFKRRPASGGLLARFALWQAWPGGVPALARVAIAVILVLGLIGGTAAAAQASLPDSPLYGLKLSLEDARLSLVGDPAQQATLALTLAAERSREMGRLAESDRPIQAQVALRLQSQLDMALQSAAAVDGPAMQRLLEQVRATTGAQARMLAQARLKALQGAQDALRQAEQAMIQAQKCAEQGLADPNTFRNRFRHQLGEPVQATVTPEATATQPAPTPRPSATPHASATHSVPVTVTPQQNQHGPGQPLAGTPRPKAFVTPGPVDPGPQSTPGPSDPGPQLMPDPPSPRSTEPPVGGSGGGGNDGGTGGGGGGTGDAGSGGGTRHP